MRHFCLVIAVIAVFIYLFLPKTKEIVKCFTICTINQTAKGDISRVMLSIKSLAFPSM